MRYSLRTPLTSLALALLVTTVAVYVAGYFALSESIPGPTLGARYRVFPARWLTAMYQPAAKVESIVTWERVETDCH